MALVGVVGVRLASSKAVAAVAVLQLPMLLGVSS